jgi:hypothetical protein
MTITIGAITFDHVEYDVDGDVLYLSVGEPREAAESFGIPEGRQISPDRALLLGHSDAQGSGQRIQSRKRAMMSAH